MGLIAGVDIGNATTEVALAETTSGASSSSSSSFLPSSYPSSPSSAPSLREPAFLASAIVPTTGIKGTPQNLQGVVHSLTDALTKAGRRLADVELIRINEAAPVIGDVAMETITETVITDSTMIGHNPATPGGLGIGVGVTVALDDLARISAGTDTIVVADRSHDFDAIAEAINTAVARGVPVTGVILQRDDGVLVANRLTRPLPIVDEVASIDKVPLGMPAAIEVAEAGRIIETLSNPFGIATLFDLSPDDTKMVVPLARSLVGNRSAVVIKTPQGDVAERRIPAGTLTFIGPVKSATVDVEAGAEAIMAAAASVAEVLEVKGEAGTNAGGMLEKVRVVMANLTDRAPSDISVTDLLAVDTLVPQRVIGAMAGEFSLEGAVGIAAMVKADRLQMERLAHDMAAELGVPVEVGGVEADMAVRGALTTPGSSQPIAILDMGAGSTDASVLRDGVTRSIHLAGAGTMVTLLIESELGLDDTELAENIKRYPLAKVETPFNIRHEDGSVEFFDAPLPPHVFARVVVLAPDGMIPVPIAQPLEVIRQVRIRAKERVFVTNAIRALRAVSPTNNVRDIDFVVLVGGSALDFEIPQLVTSALADFRVVAGRANIRGSEGPRNAVATGLVLSSGGR
ncbi:MAG: diol dehydratase reactivase subunit alpha [Propionibacteriaceae bacterium]|jgi:diol dehydratase reactivase alpha subunit|nr:diol dehydratase reactivase subunit alpha [Propionibacteriaceae bacterium]